MKYSTDILQQIEEVINPIEKALNTMQEHTNIKPATLDKIHHNLNILRYFKQHSLSASSLQSFHSHKPSA